MEKDTSKEKVNIEPVSEIDPQNSENENDSQKELSEKNVEQNILDLGSV